MIEHVSGLLPAKLALIVGAGIGAQWLAWRLQWPAVVLMSLAGLLLGPIPQMLFGIAPINPEADFGALFRPAVAVAVAVILFEGGLNLNFSDLKGAARGVRSLIFPGVVVSAALGSLAAHYVGGLAWDIALLFGGLMVVTGPTVIIPLLRHARLSGRTNAFLRWEGIVNDPIGALLAVIMFEAIRMLEAGGGWTGAALAILLGAAIGGVLGLAAGVALGWAFRRGHVPEFLKAPVVLAAVLGVFVLADFVAKETGLVAVTVFGVTMANLRLASIEEMRRFKESVAVILVASVFVALSATLTPAVLGRIDAGMILLVVVMMVVVRPVSVLISTIGAGMTWKERVLIGWIAPRGIVAVAVAGFFAAELEAIGRADGGLLTPLAFLMVFATVIAHGFTLGPLARRLGLAHGEADSVMVIGASAWSVGLAQALAKLDLPVLVVDTNYRRLRLAREAGLRSFVGEILSEHAHQRLDSASYSHLLAATPNDAYNALVCVQFAPELGRHRVWQLASYDEETAGRQIVYTARGRTLIAPERGFESLSHDWWAGWRFRTAKLSEEYTLEDLMRDRPDAEPVAELRPDGTLRFLGANSPPRGGPGATIITFGPPRAGAGEETTPSESETGRDPAPAAGVA